GGGAPAPRGGLMDPGAAMGDPRGPGAARAGGPPRPPGGRGDPRMGVGARGPIYARKPPAWRRWAAVIVGLALLGASAYWLDLTHAAVIWALFSLFVLLWPNFPPTTTGEERAQAWPFEP